MLMKSLTKRLLILAVFTVAILSFATFTTSQTHAKTYDFIFSTSYNIEYKPGQDYVTVTERLDIKVNTHQYILPANTTQEFTINDQSRGSDTTERQYKKNSLKVTEENGIEIRNYTVKDEEKAFVVSIPRGQQVDSDRPYAVLIKYNTHDLIDPKGNIINLYIPGLNEASKFEQTDPKTKTTSQIIYNSSLTVPSDAPQASYIQPATIKVSTDTSRKKRTYSIGGKDLLGITGWVQLGTSQFTYFKLTQKAPKTDFITPQEISKISDLISTNIFKISLPREFSETNQKNYYKNITPTPKSIERDDEGNLMAIFEVPANQDSEIVIEGYIEMTNKNDRPIPTVALDKYTTEVTNNTEYEKYFTNSIYWQVDNPVVTALAAELKKDKTTVNELVKADFKYIVDKFEYSREKLAGDNKRLGAVASLQGGQTVCMEYADTLIGILRAQGIAARPAFGYGNDPIIDQSSDEFSVKSTVQSSTIGHQWVQVWLPNYGWMSVDPTWGETEREYIGGDLDHILWYTVSNLSDPIYDTLLYSADINKGQSVLDNFDLELRAIDQKEYPGEAKLSSVETIAKTSIIDASNSTLEDLDSRIKTSTLGRTIIVTAPVCTALVILLFTTTAISAAVKKRRRRTTTITSPSITSPTD